MANDTVDTRVVRMEFDNKQFEKNIKQTSKSLDNLKQSLDFKGVEDSLDNVRVSISALQIAAVTFIANIATRITNLGISIVKSLSVDNISSGWSKFGEKTTSVATMMAQKIRIAGQEITDLAEKTAVVNEQLELLTWFSDETSYSFTDMVNNVGKFTAAGQDLDTSVKAMEGIATWAALSGQNATTASRAMYQLAQAMGKGKIQKIDWMSIQNANMDTEEFRATILDTAVAMGELTREGDKFVTKTGKKFSQAQFADFLSEGWFTSDVLVKGLNKYSAAIDEIYEIAQREGITASEVLEKYGDTLDQFGVKAFKAAQEARTFTDVLNSVKDAVSSKWMTTFENIFGGQEEAVKLWTDLANELYDVFAESGNFRNEILGVWKELGGRDDLFAKGGENQGAFWNLYDAIIAVRDLIKSAWNTVFPKTEMEEYSDQAEDIGRKIKGLTERLRNFTATLKTSSAFTIRLSKILQTIFGVIKMTVNALKMVRYILDPIIILAKDLINNVLDKVAYIGSKINTSAFIFEKIAIKIHDVLEGLIEELALPDFLDDIFESLEGIFKTVSDVKPISKIIDMVKIFVKSFKDAVKESNLLSSGIKVIKTIIDIVFKLGSAGAKIISAILPIIFNILSSVAEIAGSLSGIFAKTLSNIVDFLGKIFEFIRDSGLIESLANLIISSITKISKSFGPVGNFILKILKSLAIVVQKVVEILGGIIEKFTDKISSSGLLTSLGNILSGLLNTIVDFITGANSLALGKDSDLNIFTAIHSLFGGLAEIVKALLPVLTVAANALGQLLQKVAKIISALFTALSNTLTNKENGSLAGFALRLGLLLLTMFIIYKLLTSVGKMLVNINWILEGIQELLWGAVRLLRAMTFKEIAKALLFAAAAIVMIASIDTQKMIDALAIVMILAGVMMGMFSVVTTVSSAVKIGVLTKTAKALMAFRSIAWSLLIASAALVTVAKIDVAAQDKALRTILIILGAFTVVILTLQGFADANKAKAGAKIITSLSWAMIPMAVALRLLAKQPWIGIAAGTGGLLILLYSLGFITEYLSKKTSKNLDKARVAVKLIGSLAGSMLTMAIALRLLASQPWLGLTVATVSMMAMILTFTSAIEILSKKTSKNLDKARVAVKLIGSLAGSMLTMAIALRLLASQPWYQIAAATGSILLVLMEFMFVVEYLSKKTGTNAEKTKMATKILRNIAISLLVTSLALKLLANEPWKGMLTGIGAITLVLGAFSLIILILTKIAKNNLLKITKATVLIRAMAVSLLLTGIALLSIALIPWNKILVSLLIVTAVFGILIGAMLILSKLSTAGADPSQGIVKLALSLMIFGVALSALANGFRSFNGIDFWSIVKGLIAAAGAVLVLGLATKLIESSTIVLLGIASAMILLGVGLIAIGYGITVLAGAFDVLGDSSMDILERITELIANLAVKIVEGIIELTPKILDAIGIILDKLIELVPKIVELISVIIEGVLEILDNQGPHIIETVVTLLDILMRTLNEHMGSIADSVFGILKTILARIASNIEDLAQSLVDIMLGLLKTLTKNIGPLTKAFIEFLVELVVALFQNIGPLIDVVTDYVFDFIARVIVAITGKVIALAGLITKVVLIILAAVIRMTIASLGALSKLFITFVASLLLILVHTFIGLSSVLFEVFKVMIKESLKVLVEAIIWLQDAFVAIGKIVMSLILRGLVQVFLTLAGWLLDLIDLIFGSNIKDKVQGVADNLAQSARDAVNGISASTKQVENAIKNASNNINGVVGMTANMANEAVVDGMSQISSTVTDSMGQLSSAMSEFGEEAGANLYTGMGSSDNVNGANQVGKDMGNATAEGFAEATETHSPSRLFARFGNFLMQGLSQGIQNGSSETENAIAEVIGDSLQLATDILDGQEGDDYTIKVGMDISSVEAQTSKIQDIMSGVNDPRITASGQNAGYNARSLERNNRKGSETVNNDNSTKVTYNNTFNIESTDPQQSADEIDKVLKQQNTRFKLAHGT